MNSSVLLSNYFRRIGFSREPAADLETLREIHLLHATHIPFENIDILFGKRISLKIEDLQHKLLEQERGGYCFEQNTLLYEVLKQIGFEVIRCEARVRYGSSIMMPRTHMVLVVTWNGIRYLCDVGFGGDGLLCPVEFSPGSQRQFQWQYQLRAEGELQVLQSFRKEGWLDLYAFLPEDRYAIDFELANWYTSTHPDSRFVQTLTAQLPTPEARHILRNRTYVIQTAEQEESRELKSLPELFDLLENVFHLKFPRDTKLNIRLFDEPV